LMAVVVLPTPPFWFAIAMIIRCVRFRAILGARTGGVKLRKNGSR
jgi:hypothetical protein